MVILRKKRILALSILLLLCLSVGLLFSSQKKEDTVSTVSLPVSNKTIILDAGHGVPDEGVRLLH